MKSTPFYAESDLAPVPFTDEICRAARLMKEKGLEWRPHVGCFVWDENQFIEVSSPFPHRVYFILNLGHFLKRFETIENIIDKLVWIPTWHQARQVCKRLEISDSKIVRTIQQSSWAKPGAELLDLYKLILEYL